MKLSVLLLPALLALSSASVQNVAKRSSQMRKVPILNPDLGNRIPKITINGSMLALPTPPELQNSLDQSASFMIGGSNLQWQYWPGYLPNGAVGIYNGYAGRYDYVCKSGCESGFYSSSMGPYCYYPFKHEEYYTSSFEILVNKDNFEVLEWKEESYGQLPPNSVRNCYSQNKFAAKNEYGLGKVHVENECFYLPWEGDEYWYYHYHVLTINKNIYEEHIFDVIYNTNADVIAFPPEAMRKSTITNNQCSTVVKTLQLQKTYQEEKRWETSTAISAGVRCSITVKIPLIASAGIDFGAEVTQQFTSGTSIVESNEYSVAVEVTVPPNHSCTVTMVGYKYTANIPYTARLRRTYRHGETTWTYISGTYTGVDVGEVRSVVDRCEPIPGAQPCH
ncbi:natterin-3-like [Pempheris klunzingeri]|uniref:natterin-3-like n=1 Tax=Pempheris klunzingeri TaxID=3127111 RepID=UPI0039800704